MIEINKKPLVDILSEQLGEQVVMSGDNYVLMCDTKSVVKQSDVDVATAKQSELYDLEVVLNKQAKAKQYLSDTDWYITRRAETGKEIPQEVITKRNDARKLLAS